MKEITMIKILVTGGSGFVGSTSLLQLLASGYQVCTTIRSLKRESDVRSMLREGGAEACDRLSFVEADLETDAGWAEAVAGCEYVLHAASPFPLRIPKHENELIIPAREGTLRVLRAARDASVKRVVLTSSFAAIGYGHAPQNAPFDETHWTNLAAEGLSAYVKSKTLAERAAWDFIASDGGSLELSVVNPVGILGPVLGTDFASSVLLIKRLMDGAIPGCPRLSFGLVDVRDVVDLHIRAMLHPAAKGQRFIAAAGEPMSMLEAAELLKNRMGDAAKRVPLRKLPDWLLRAFALVNPEMRQIVSELGSVKRCTGEKAKRMLGWAPRSREDAVLASAESLVRLGLLRDSLKKAPA